MMQALMTHAARLKDRLKPLGARSVYSSEHLEVIGIETGKLFKIVEHPLCLFLLDSSELDRALGEDPSWLDRFYFKYLKEYREIVLVYTKSSAAIQRLVLNTTFAPGRPACALDKLLSEGDVASTLKSVLLANVGATRLSPYRISQYSAGHMFFGRDSDIHKLQNGTGHCIITGARRIGKTSLARRYQHLLAGRDVSAGSPELDGHKIRSCAYLDLIDKGSIVTEIFWGHLLEAFGLDPSRYGPYSRRASGREQPHEIKALAFSALIRRTTGTKTVILDEADAWIEREADDGWPTLDLLRGLAETGELRIILVGYESLAIAANKDRFPLHGRHETIVLGPLERKAMNDLVLHPLKDFGIKLEPETPMLDNIWSTTNGFPHLVQDICHRLVEVALEGNRPTLSPANLRTALKNSDPLRKYRRGIINSQFPLAEALAGATLFASHRDPSRATEVKQIIDRLKKHGFTYHRKEFDLALRHLELRRILAPVDDTRTRWTWVDKHQAESLLRSIDMTGEENWTGSLLYEHEQGSWRKRYQRLAALGHYSEEPE